MKKDRRVDETARVYPINVIGGYYCRNEQEFKFDKMLREHAKEQGKEAMYQFIRDQDLRNSLRRIEDALTKIAEQLGD